MVGGRLLIPVRTGIVQIQYPTRRTPFRLKYKSVPADTDHIGQYRTVPVNTGQYQTTFKYILCFNYRTILVGTGKHQTIFYF